MALSMVVYWEYAFAENFLLDFLLLFLSVKTARGKIRPLSLALSSAVGGAEAVLFPLLTLPTLIAYLVKFSGGGLLVLLAMKRERNKTYLIAFLAFFGYTFALGGMLVALYSFFEVEYLSGKGYLVESAPVGLILGGGGTFVLLLSFLIKRAYAFQKLQRNILYCTLKKGEKKGRIRALVDSGNLLEYNGEPVSVMSLQTAYLLFGGNQTFEGELAVATVGGHKKLPLLRCCVESLYFERKDALFAVGSTQSKDFQVILHTAWLEGAHGNIVGTQKNSANDKGE